MKAIFDLSDLLIPILNDTDQGKYMQVWQEYLYFKLLPQNVKHAIRSQTQRRIDGVCY